MKRKQNWATDWKAEYAKLCQRIKEIAVANEPDYPDVESVDVWQHLWAIDEGTKGRDAAIKDLHAYIEMFCQVTEEKREQFRKVHPSVPI